MHNGLSLNPAKSEVIQFSTRRSTVNKLQSLSVSGTPVQPSSTVKSLGVTLDQHLSLDQHINNVCKASYYHIRSEKRRMICLSKITQLQPKLV